MEYNHVVDRVKLYMKAEKRVFEDTGEAHPLYCNVTDRLPKDVRASPSSWWTRAATASWLNYLAVGPEAMRATAEDKDINVPILAHMDCAGAYYMSPHHGIASPYSLGQAAQARGADTVVIPFALGGKAAVTCPSGSSRSCRR